MEKIFFSIIISVCLFTGTALALGTSSIVEKGNRLYRGQKYEDALKFYDQALSNQPDSAVINFNAGTAQYKTHDYQKANGSFEKSLIVEDRGLEAKANYNLGNSKYMLGLSKEKTDLSIAVQLLEGALNNYKRTQEITPKDEDVKVNYKIVAEKLKELKEKLKQQPQENKNNQKQQEQNQGQGKNQQGGPQQEQEKSGDKQGQDQQSEQSRQEGQEQQQKEGEKKNQEQQAAARSSNQKEEPGSASAQSQESKEMSKEEANMLLEGYRQEENTAGMLKDKRKGAEERVLKDW